MLDAQEVLKNINLKRNILFKKFKSWWKNWEQIFFFCSFVYVSLTYFLRLSSIKRYCPSISLTWCFIFPLSLVPSDLLQLLPCLPLKPHFSQFQDRWQISMRNIRASLFSWHFLQNVTHINLCGIRGKTPQNTFPDTITIWQTLQYVNEGFSDLKGSTKRIFLQYGYCLQLEVQAKQQINLIHTLFDSLARSSLSFQSIVQMLTHFNLSSQMIPLRIICVCRRATHRALIKAPDNFFHYYIFQDCQKCWTTVWTFFPLCKNIAYRYPNDSGDHQ